MSDLIENTSAPGNPHPPGILWMTGLPAAGKSTLAAEVEGRLRELGYRACVLDGDTLRRGLNADLGYSPDDRAENIRRVGEVAALLARLGHLVIVACISPYRVDRERARRAAASESFHEIYIKADVDACERRDPKGNYALAREGKIPEFTGVSAPYEAPKDCELVVDTVGLDVEASVALLMSYVAAELPLDGAATG